MAVNYVKVDVSRVFVLFLSIVMRQGLRFLPLRQAVARMHVDDVVIDSILCSCFSA